VNHVTVRGEQRTLPIENGWITDWFDGYEAHIYRFPLRGGGSTDAPELGAARDAFSLRVFPNPSRGHAQLEFHLPETASAVFTVYDAGGRRVALAGSGRYEAGSGTVRWNGRDFHGSPVAPGVYFVRAKTSLGETASAKILLQR
jgi:hypothetical protein